MKPGRLILVVTDLDQLVQEAGPLPVVLENILARGRETVPVSGEHALDSVLDFPLPGIAALTCPEECGAVDSTGIWLRADPIHLVPDLSRVWVGHLAGSGDGLTSAQHEALVEGFTELFDSVGMTFFWSGDGGACLRLSELPRASFTPAWRIAGRNLETVLPAGPDSGQWRRLLNETQMLFHQVLRQGVAPAAGSTAGPAPNSLWFWGPGRRPLPPSRSGLDEYRGGCPLVHGLAGWLGLPEARNGPEGIEGRCLAAWEPCKTRSADDNLRNLDTRWLAPAWRAVRRGALSELVLVSADRVWRLRPMDAWRFWKRRVPSQRIEDQSA